MRVGFGGASFACVWLVGGGLALLLVYHVKGRVRKHESFAQPYELGRCIYALASSEEVGDGEVGACFTEHPSVPFVTWTFGEDVSRQLGELAGGVVGGGGERGETGLVVFAGGVDLKEDVERWTIGREIFVEP